MTLVSIVLFCVETLPVFSMTHCVTDEAPNFLDPLSLPSKLHSVTVVGRLAPINAILFGECLRDSFTLLTFSHSTAFWLGFHTEIL